MSATIAAAERVAAFLEWHLLVDGDAAVASYPGNRYEPPLDLLVSDLRELLTAALHPEPRTGRARTSDPATSQQGARSIAMRAGSQRHKLLLAYASAALNSSMTDDLTDSEAARFAEVPPHSCYWKRCSELRQDGLIAYTGDTRPDAISGEQRATCTITPDGRVALRVLTRP